MDTFLAVIKDLWNFVCGTDQKGTGLNIKAETLLIAPPPELKKLTETKLLSLGAAQVRNVDLAPKTQGDFNGAVNYITASPGLVFNRPVLSYDGIVTTLPYGTLTQVLAYEGRFARVVLGETTGWILKDDLTTQATDVFPVLLTGTIYEEDNLETQKLRKYIEDEFFTKELFLPLQSVEYVSYQLKRHGLKIAWPAVRPRLAGNWQNILKGKNGIKIGLLPKTGAIIEYNNDDGTGFVGYTQAVKVDESIVISGVGRQVIGEYREEVIQKSEWQNWRSVWISVS